MYVNPPVTGKSYSETLCEGAGCFVCVCGGGVVVSRKPDKGSDLYFQAFPPFIQWHSGLFSSFRWYSQPGSHTRPAGASWCGELDVTERHHRGTEVSLLAGGRRTAQTGLHRQSNAAQRYGAGELLVICQSYFK